MLSLTWPRSAIVQRPAVSFIGPPGLDLHGDLANGSQLVLFFIRQAVSAVVYFMVNINRSADLCAFRDSEGIGLE
jgi:hypothetical protein